MATSPTFCRIVSSSESSCRRRLVSGERGGGTGEAFGGGEEQKGEDEAEEEGRGVAGTASKEAERELLGRDEDRDGWLDWDVVCHLLRSLNSHESSPEKSTWVWVKSGRREARGATRREGQWRKGECT